MSEPAIDYGFQPQGEGDSLPHLVASPAAQLSDADRRLQPLVQAIGEDLADQFFWKAETGTIQTYEHRLTYRHVHVDRVTGQFCDQERAPISAEKAVARALSRSMASTAPLHVMLAPIVVDPDLTRFVRRLSSADVDTKQVAFPQASPSGEARLIAVAARMYRHLQKKFLTMGNYARTASVPAREHTGDSRGDLQGTELSLAGFTRRTAY